MNKDRRKLLAEAIDMMTGAQTLLEQARDEEQEYYDNMPEGIQSGDKGSAAEEVISALDDAITGIEDAIGQAETAKGEA